MTLKGLKMFQKELEDCFVIKIECKDRKRKECLYAISHLLTIKITSSVTNKNNA